MKIIAHRGLLSGPDILLENSPTQINNALSNGFDVEIDVWLINDELFLGHLTPTYPITATFLKQTGIWAHAKNLEAFEFLLDNNVNCFWHQTDDFTCTSEGYIWTYVGKTQMTSRSIFVQNENYNFDDIRKIMPHGVCTDYPVQLVIDLGRI